MLSEKYNLFLHYYKKQKIVNNKFSLTFVLKELDEYRRNKKKLTTALR